MSVGHLFMFIYVTFIHVAELDDLLKTLKSVKHIYIHLVPIVLNFNCCIAKA